MNGRSLFGVSFPVRPSPACRRRQPPSPTQKTAARQYAIFYKYCFQLEVTLCFLQTLSRGSPS